MLSVANIIRNNFGRHNENERKIYNSIVNSILTYSCEEWFMIINIQSILCATKMDYWRRLARKSRLEKAPKARIKKYWR